MPEGAEGVLPARRRHDRRRHDGAARTDGSIRPSKSHRRFSGRFNVRLDPATHAAAVLAAAAENKSLDEWVAQAIASATARD